MNWHLQGLRRMVRVCQDLVDARPRTCGLRSVPTPKRWGPLPVRHL